MPLSFSFANRLARAYASTIDPTVTSMQVRLVSGDVDLKAPVTWQAAASAPWISVQTRSGIVYTEAPVIATTVGLDSVGFADSDASDPIAASVSIRSESSAPQFARNSDGKPTEVLSIAVEMVVEASVQLNRSDVLLKTSIGVVVSDGGSIERRTGMSVLISAFDFERLPINFTRQLIQLCLSGTARYRAAHRGHGGSCTHVTQD